MKLRYYLRGLGTGILVAALILGRLIGESRPLTDAEIKAKALTLGMVDANSLSLSDVGGNESFSQESLNPGPATGSPGPDAGKATDPDGAVNPGITDSPDSVTSPVPSTSPEIAPESTMPAPESVESVTIEIFRGDSSYAVSKRLEEAGLVEDAREFDAYLMENGHSRSIRAGIYRIPAGASWEEIADIIS